jgi:polysaccharide biosynthesis protein PslG
MSTVARLCGALLAVCVAPCGCAGGPPRHSSGTYMGHDWSIDESRVVHWDGAPYIRYGATGCGDVEGMVALGFTQFSVCPDEQRFIMSSDPQDRAEAVAAVAERTRHLSDIGATYYAGINGFWPWQASKGKIGPEDYLTYVVRAVSSVGEARTSPTSLRLTSARIGSRPALRLDGLDVAHVAAYCFLPGRQDPIEVSESVTGVDAVEAPRPRERRVDAGQSEGLVLTVTMDAAEVPREAEALLVALIRIKTTHALDGAPLPALWRPSLIEYYRACLADMGQAYRTEGLRGLMFGDEIQTWATPLWAAVYPDFGADEHAMRQYAGWLEQRFGDIGAMNRSFGSDFTAFADVPWHVVPIPAEDQRGRFTWPFGSPQQLEAVSAAQDEFRCWLYGHWLAEYGRMAKEAIGDVPVFITVAGCEGPAQAYCQIEKWALADGLDGLVRNHYGDVGRLEGGGWAALLGWRNAAYPLRTVVDLLQEAERQSGLTKAYWCNEFGLVSPDRPLSDDEPPTRGRETEGEWGGFGYEFRFDSKERLRDFLFMLVDNGYRGMNRFLIDPRPDLPGPREELVWLAELRGEVCARTLQAGSPQTDPTEQQMEAYWRAQRRALALTPQTAIRSVLDDPRSAELREAFPNLDLSARYADEYGCWIVRFIADGAQVGFATVGDDGKVLEWVRDAGEEPTAGALPLDDVRLIADAQQAVRPAPDRESGTALGAEPTVQRDPFPSAIPEAFGFNTHYWDFTELGKRGADMTWSPEQWDVWWGKLDPLAGMAESGFPIHRATVAWHDSEAPRGTYNWSLQDALMQENQRCGLRPLLLLAYGHPEYDASSGPSPSCGVYSVLTQEGREGFAAWARQVARRYRGRQAIYELWNEPNITLFWPKPDPDAYVALVEAAAPAIRSEDPTAIILGGALSPKDMGDQLDLPFLNRCVGKGLLEHVDAISWHPYNLDRPERVREQIATLRALVDRHAPVGRRIELLVSEVGYTIPDSPEGYLREGGHFVPRLLLSNLSLGVPTVLYEVCPGAVSGWNLIVRPRASAECPGTWLYPRKQAWGYKPGVAAVRVMSEALHGFSVVRRLEVGDPNDDFVFELHSGSRRALAFWTAAENERELVLPLPAGAGTLVSYEAVVPPTDAETYTEEQRRTMGEYMGTIGQEAGVRTPVRWPEDELTLPLSNWPKYLLIDGEPDR